MLAVIILPLLIILVIITEIAVANYSKKHTDGLEKGQDDDGASADDYGSF